MGRRVHGPAAKFPRANNKQMMIVVSPLNAKCCIDTRSAAPWLPSFSQWLDLLPQWQCVSSFNAKSKDALQLQHSDAPRIYHGEFRKPRKLGLIVLCIDVI
jgi:hypothetical protein